MYKRCKLGVREPPEKKRRLEMCEEEAVKRNRCPDYGPGDHQSLFSLFFFCTAIAVWSNPTERPTQKQLERHGQGRSVAATARLIDAVANAARLYGEREGAGDMQASFVVAGWCIKQALHTYAHVLVKLERAGDVILKRLELLLDEPLQLAVATALGIGRWR